MIGKFERRGECAFCGGTRIVKFIEMGNMPLAGGFLRKEDVGREKFYPLNVYFCEDCKLAQLLEIVPRKVLFEEYFYLSSTTRTLSNHFMSLAKLLNDRFLGKDSLVVEIGSNDGVFLKPMKDMGMRAIGFEPSKNVSEIARSKGLEIVNDYFTERSASDLVGKEGRADLISASNVFAHIDNIRDVVMGVKSLLKDDGVFVFEVHYLLDLVEKMQYDTIYHEHMYYHSMIALKKFFEGLGMEIFDVERIPIHEGSIRVFVKKKNDRTHEVTPSVEWLLNLEKQKGLDSKETFLKFGQAVRNHRSALVALLREIKSRGKTMIGYGAPGRGNTLLNYCKIGTEMLDYVTDESPTRAGKFIPGMHIPIVSPEKIMETRPDVALMLAWSYKDEILEKEKEFVKKGGKFVVPLPSPKVIP